MFMWVNHQVLLPDSLLLSLEKHSWCDVEVPQGSANAKEAYMTLPLCHSSNCADSRSAHVDRYVWHVLVSCLLGDCNIRQSMWKGGSVMQRTCLGLPALTQQHSAGKWWGGQLIKHSWRYAGVCCSWMIWGCVMTVHMCNGCMRHQPQFPSNPHTMLSFEL